MRSLHRCVFLALLAFALATGVHAASLPAMRELGQPDFTHYLPNRVDGRGVTAPSAVAVDTSRTPSGLWLLDTNNNRALGWRDASRAAAGAAADLVIGQPDSLSFVASSEKPGMTVATSTTAKRTLPRACRVPTRLPSTPPDGST